MIEKWKTPGWWTWVREIMDALLGLLDAVAFVSQRRIQINDVFAQRPQSGGIQSDGRRVQ
jgi:hypothetical protein